VEMFADLRFRLRALLRRDVLERELDDELRFHLERETDKLMRAGFTRAEAERRARISFGGLDRIKDDSRDARGVDVIESIQQDLRYAWRGLASRPGFTLSIVLTLALGIAANTAMFGIVDRLLFRQPAYLGDAANSHRVYVRFHDQLTERVERNIEYTRYADLARWTTSFDRMAAFADRDMAVGTGLDAREMNVAAVSASYFDFFTARPMLGRFFGADEDRAPSGAHVAVLGHTFWRVSYGGARDVLGKPITIGDQTYTIIGVAPEHFVGVTEQRPPAAFIPITTFAFNRQSRYYQTYNWSWLEVVAHRRPGVSIETASADLTAAHVRSWEAERVLTPTIPTVEKGRPRGEIAPMQMARGPQASTDSKVVTWIMGVALIVLLIACANVANLLLARAIRRRREIALRLALGVTRRRLLQQLATESLLLALIGASAGLLAAQWGGQTLRALFLRGDDAGAVITDARTLGFVLAATVLVAMATGLAPALHALRGDLTDALKSGTREGTYRRSRLRTSLLVLQGALSVVLLVGAGLFVRSLQNVRDRRLGYDVAPVVYAEASMRGTNLSDSEQNALNDRLLEATRSIPGVRSATLTISVPFWSNEGRGAPFVPGVDSVARLGRFFLQAGSPAYFETLGTRIARGRAFNEHDRAETPRVLVVSEQMASALWPGQDPIGKQLRFGTDTTPFSTVIGVAEDMRARLFQGSTEMWYFMPIAQYAAFYGATYPQVFARVNGSADDFVEPLRRRLQREMPGAAYVQARSLERMVGTQEQSWRFGATMFVAFGCLALVLAAVGLYSVIAYAVAQRTHELGVRIALGASVMDVVSLIVRQGLAFAVAGIAIGSGIALWAGKWIEPMLFAQKARDPLVFGSVAVVLLVVSVAATLRPAVRATRVDPTTALRAD
ncbi:MAG: ADOP family duplicated permease, partial [Gemmatimonadaceae bacterium]